MEGDGRQGDAGFGVSKRKKTRIAIAVACALSSFNQLCDSPLFLILLKSQDAARLTSSIAHFPICAVYQQLRLCT